MQLEVAICSDSAVVHLERIWEAMGIGELSDNGTCLRVRDPADMEVFWLEYVRPYAIFRW